jgi:hypothetical protein
MANNLRTTHIINSTINAIDQSSQSPPSGVTAPKTGTFKNTNKYKLPEKTIVPIANIEMESLNGRLQKGAANPAKAINAKAW